MLAKILVGVILCWIVLYGSVAFVVWDIDWLRNAGTLQYAARVSILLGFAVAAIVGAIPLWMKILPEDDD